MIASSTLKKYRKLRQKKYREKYGWFIVEGYNYCVDAVNSDFEVEIMLTTHEFIESDHRFPKLETMCKSANIPIESLNQSQFDAIADTKTPQGILGVLKMAEQHYEISETGIILALDGVSDPGNAGAVVRSAHWFGINQIVFGEDSAEIYNPKLVRTAAGAIFYLPVFQKMNLLEWIPIWKKAGFTVYTAEMKGELLTNDFKPAEKTVLIMGSESHGVSHEVSIMADKIVTIPRIGNMESLNISVAAGILMDRFTRK